MHTPQQLESMPQPVDSRRSKKSEQPKEGRALYEAFSDFIQIEKDLERMKIEITLKDDYNLIDAFGILDA